MKKILLLFILIIFTITQKTTATPVDVIKQKMPSKETVRVKEKKKKKRFLDRLTDRILKRRIGKVIKKLKLAPSSCDQIIKTNGERLNIVIINNGDERIRYKKCDYLNGPTYTIHKEDISVIKFADGKVEIVDDEKIKAIKIANQTDYKRLFWNFGFGLSILLNIFALLFIAVFLSGEKRRQAFRGAFAGLLTLLILFLTLGILLASSI